MEIILSLDLDVCLDIGHLVVQQQSLEAFWQTFGKRVTIIHLHGAANQKDHLALDVLPLRYRRQMFKYLQEYSGTVSIEVFNYTALVESLHFLGNKWFKKN